MVTKWFTVACLLLAFCAVGRAEESPDVPPAAQDAPRRLPLVLSERQEDAVNVSVTQHSIVNENVLTYTARAGCLPLKDEAGQQTAEIFFVAYERDEGGDPWERPIAFVFNGGPGASSLWLHLGAIGPKQVGLEGKGKGLVGAYQPLADNELSWLHFMDLVFVDPVGTGYSRPAPGQDAKSFFSVHGDIRSMSEFIRRFVTRYNRWLSPKFIVGESYGTIRAAGLVQDLFENCGMELKGLVLISPALSLPAITVRPGNDLPFALFLPSYTAAAWHHKKLPSDLQKNLSESLKKVEQWVLQEYWVALMKGNSLNESERAKAVEGLARFTGLPKSLIEKLNLRVPSTEFTGELLRDQHLRLSLFDGRATADREPASILEDPAFGPTISPLVTTFLHYLKDELRYDTDRLYAFFSSNVNTQWDWDTSPEGAETGLAMLQKGMNRNRRLRVFVASGIYDLDTPYLATHYTLNHLAIDPAQQKNITLKTYESGHMPYTVPATLKQLTDDVSDFVKSALLGESVSR